MPRLTDALKELRRAQITDFADNTAGCGPSAGSIYTHYRDKAELVQAVAHAVLTELAETLGAYAASDTPPDPDELLARLIAGIDPASARIGVQTWGEATTDPAIRAMVLDMTSRMRALLHDCVTAWLVKVEHHEPAQARELATPITRRVSALYQAALLYTALQPEETTP